MKRRKILITCTLAAIMLFAFTTTAFAAYGDDNKIIHNGTAIRSGDRRRSNKAGEGNAMAVIIAPFKRKPLILKK